MAVEPAPALPGQEITVSGRGGLIQDSCGGVNESARAFQLYLDEALKPVADLVCYVNHCEVKLTLAASTTAGTHCLSTQAGACEFEFEVGAP